MKTVLFNPYTGTPRHLSDIVSDPAGLLIRDDVEPLRAAPQAQAAGQELADLFESWWSKHGQFCRAGGGDYEKLFAWAAWNTALAQRQPLTLGRELFKFDSFPGWVNHAQRAWKAAGVRPKVTICIDAKGRPCRIGRDFMKARDESAFPVRVYLLRDEDDPTAHGIGASGGEVQHG